MPILKGAGPGPEARGIGRILGFCHVQDVGEDLWRPAARRIVALVGSREQVRAERFHHPVMREVLEGTREVLALGADDHDPEDPVEGFRKKASHEVLAACLEPELPVPVASRVASTVLARVSRLDPPVRERTVVLMGEAKGPLGGAEVEEFLARARREIAAEAALRAPASGGAVQDRKDLSGAGAGAPAAVEAACPGGAGPPPLPPAPSSPAPSVPAVLRLPRTDAWLSRRVLRLLDRATALLAAFGVAGRWVFVPGGEDPVTSSDTVPSASALLAARAEAALRLPVPLRPLLDWPCAAEAIP
jgi:hypothetical protein